MSKMEKILKMVDDLIELEKQKDEVFKRKMIAAHKGSQALGESITIEYLRNLRLLVIEVIDEQEIR